MSIVRHAQSPNWYYSFQLNGKKHFGSTGTSNKTVAKKVEDSERRKAIEASAPPGMSCFLLSDGIEFMRSTESKRLYPSTCPISCITVVSKSA